MHNKKFLLKEIASFTNSRLHGNPDHEINGVAGLEEATENDISFFSNILYLKKMKASKAGAIFVDEKTPITDEPNFLITANPSKAFQIVAEKFYEDFNLKQKSTFQGIHETVIIHKSAKISKNITIAPYAIIDQEAIIGEGTYIGPYSHIGLGVTIGSNCHIYSNVNIQERTIIGNRVVIQSGSIIGTYGFGYTTDKNGKHEKIKQLGNVEIEDDVEIGSNTVIDRARFKTTRIGQGTKIGSLVQIAHGVKIGKNNLLVGQIGIAGSSSTGDGVIIGGQAAIAGHLHIANGAMIAGRAAVSKSLTKENEAYVGEPAMPKRQMFRQFYHIRKLEKYAEQIKSLEEQVKKLSKSIQ